jgi:hypothetical protein
MECRECDSFIHDFMRADARTTTGADLPANVANEELRSKVFDHIARCQRCELRFADIRSLEAALHALTQNMDPEQCAVRLEPALIAAFQQQKRAMHRSRSLSAWATVGIAASLLLAIGVASRYWIFAPEQRPPALVTPQSVQLPSVSSAKTSETATVPPREVEAHRTPRRRVPTPPASNKELVTDFYALPYGTNSDRAISGEIVRVKLRGSALPAIGFPVALNGDQAAAQITADLVVGENGLPLAIRFVR